MGGALDPTPRAGGSPAPRSWQWFAKGRLPAIPANDMTVQATFNAKLFGIAAYATIKGFVVKWTLRKCQASSFNITRDIRGEAHLVERAFNVGLGVLAEVVQVITQQFELQATWHRQ